VRFVEKPYEKPFETHEEMRKTLSTMGLGFHISYWLGIIFAVIGVIGDAANITLGLESTSWLLLSIVAFVAGVPMLVTWAVAMHLLGMKVEK
jgi:ABC-type amino acid transport system permease subunit